MIVDRLALRIEMLNIGLCSYDTPNEIGGTTKHGICSATNLVIFSTIKESVETGKCSPCCSIDPTGIIARLTLLITSQNSPWVILYIETDISLKSGSLTSLSTLQRFELIFFVDMVHTVGERA
jgi:hypothetical protein